MPTAVKLRKSFYRCVWCRQLFEFGSGLLRHIDADHGEIHPFARVFGKDWSHVVSLPWCADCGRSFGADEWYLVHLERVHGADGAALPDVQRRTRRSL